MLQYMAEESVEYDVTGYDIHLYCKIQKYPSGYNITFETVIKHFFDTMFFHYINTSLLLN